MSPPTELQALISQSSITASFVVGQVGEVAGPEQNSSGLSNQTDRQLLRAIRSNAEIVLTSGKTARLEHYKMPRTADLAIFTTHGISELELVPKAGQELVVIGPDKAKNYRQAFDYLKLLGYKRIQLEFGPAGFEALRDLVDLTVVSGISVSGVSKFASDHQLTPRREFHLENLVVWAC